MQVFARLNGIIWKTMDFLRLRAAVHMYPRSALPLSAPRSNASTFTSLHRLCRGPNFFPVSAFRISFQRIEAERPFLRARLAEERLDVDLIRFSHGILRGEHVMFSLRLFHFIEVDESAFAYWVCTLMTERIISRYFRFEIMALVKHVGDVFRRFPRPLVGIVRQAFNI